jgi:hypothetical protein
MTLLAVLIPLTTPRDAYLSGVKLVQKTGGAGGGRGIGRDGLYTMAPGAIMLRPNIGLA